MSLRRKSTTRCKSSNCITGAISAVEDKIKFLFHNCSTAEAMAAIAVLGTYFLYPQITVLKKP